MYHKFFLLLKNDAVNQRTANLYLVPPHRNFHEDSATNKQTPPHTPNHPLPIPQCRWMQFIKTNFDHWFGSASSEKLKFSFFISGISRHPANNFRDPFLFSWRSIVFGSSRDMITNVLYALFSYMLFIWIVQICVIIIKIFKFINFFLVKAYIYICSSKIWKFLAGILFLVPQEALRIIQPILLGLLVDYFSVGSTTERYTALIYAGLFSLNILLLALVHGIYFWYLTRLGMNVRVALVTTVYQTVRSQIRILDIMAWPDLLFWVSWRVGGGAGEMGPLGSDCDN